MSSETQRFGGHYDVVGEGLPVLCLAGFGCSNWIFDYMAQALSAHVQMIMPDNRGMGRSPHADEPYTLDDLAADALGLMDDLGIQRFAVLGISMGGFVAQSLCLQAPQRVRGLMLLCATGPGDAFVPLPQISNEMLAESYTQPVVEMIRHNTEITTSPNFERRDPEMFMRILQKKFDNLADLEQLKLQNLAAFQYVSVNRPLEQITCKTLILTGADDAFVDPENSHILARILPDAQVHQFPISNHLFFLERAEDVHRHLLTFLEQL